MIPYTRCLFLDGVLLSPPLGPFSGIGADNALVRWDGTDYRHIQDAPFTHLTDTGHMSLGQVAAPVGILELWADDAHPILTITAAQANLYDPQIQFRTDATDTVKFSLGVDGADDKFKIFSGSGIGGTTEFVMDASGGIKCQNSVNSTTAYQWLDADGGVPVMNIDTTNERVGIRIAAPSHTFSVLNEFLINSNGNVVNIKADPYLNQDSNFFLGVGAGGAGNLNHTTGNTGWFNTGVGNQTLNAVTTGYENVAIGANALLSLTSAQANMAIGTNALRSLTTSPKNVAIGRGALYNTDSTNGSNVGIGYHALRINTDGEFNVAIGGNALELNEEGCGNMAIGDKALYRNVDADNSVAVGRNALNWNVSGGHQVAIGYGALYKSGANYNVGIGAYAGRYNESGANNVLIGREAGYGKTGDSYANNTFVGYRSGLAIETGSNNILIGYLAGDTLTTGDKNILIGNNIDAPSITSDGQMSIGNLIFGTGIDGTGTTISNGKFGLAEPAPETLFEMTSTAPYYTAHNSTEENIESGRECIWRGKGEKANGTEHTLGQMQFSHDGTGDDYKADFILSVNQNGGADTLVEAVRIDSAGLMTYTGTSIFQNSANSTTAYQWLDADGGVPVINIDTTNERVGIGTATPSSNLDVVGTLGFSDVTGDVNFFTNEVIGNTTNGNAIFVHRNSDSEGHQYAKLYINQFKSCAFVSNSNILFDTGTDNGGYIYFLSEKNIFFNIGNDDYLYIRDKDSNVLLTVVESTGNVGFGEIVPETAIELTNVQPYFTFHNPTEENTPGGRESLTIHKGEKANGFEHVLGIQEFSHDLDQDDQKGRYILSLNAGADGDSPTEVQYIDSTGLMTVKNVIQGATSLWWRIQHIDISALPATGAVGAIYTTQSANNLNGYQLDNSPSEEYLYFNAHAGSDWDGASDLEVYVQFETNVDNSGGLSTDTVDFDLVMYYKGNTETVQKTQVLAASVVVGEAAQYYHSSAMFTIDHDKVDHVLNVGDCISFRLHLNTDDSEVDDVIVHHAMFRYKTNKVRAEV